MVVAVIAGYLIGSVPFAVLIGRLKRRDPRDYGDRNPGWWNSRAVLGERAALIVAVGDIGKGALAAWVGTLIWGPWWTAFLALFAAMVGHAFPVFAHFRGGRSILTFVGGFLVLSPEAAGIAIAAGIVLAIATRKFEFGARLAMFVFPFVMLFFDPFTHVIWAFAMMMFIGARFWAARTDDLANGAPA